MRPCYQLFHGRVLQLMTMSCTIEQNQKLFVASEVTTGLNDFFETAMGQFWKIQIVDFIMKAKPEYVCICFEQLNCKLTFFIVGI